MLNDELSEQLDRLMDEFRIFDYVDDSPDELGVVKIEAHELEKIFLDVMREAAMSLIEIVEEVEDHEKRERYLFPTEVNHVRNTHS